jgi:transporter family-2 protein
MTTDVRTPWWAPLGGLIGAFAGLTITADILTSLEIDHFGMLHLQPHPMNFWRTAGGLVMVAGVARQERN